MSLASPLMISRWTALPLPCRFGCWRGASSTAAASKTPAEGARAERAGRVRSAPILAKRRDEVEDAMDSYHFFTFGTPSVTQLSDGTIAAATCVTEEHVT